MNEQLLAAADFIRQRNEAMEGKCETPAQLAARNREALGLINTETGGRVLKHVMDADGQPPMYHFSRLNQWMRAKGIDPRKPYLGLIAEFERLGFTQPTLENRISAYRDKHLGDSRFDLGHGLGK